MVATNASQSSLSYSKNPNAQSAAASSAPAGPRNSRTAALMAVAVVLHSSVSANTISGATEPESHVTVPVSAGQTLKMLFSTVACDSQLSVTVMYFKSPAEQPK